MKIGKFQSVCTKRVDGEFFCLTIVAEYLRKGDTKADRICIHYAKYTNNIAGVIESVLAGKPDKWVISGSAV